MKVVLMKALICENIKLYGRKQKYYKGQVTSDYSKMHHRLIDTLHVHSVIAVIF